MLQESFEEMVTMNEACGLLSTDDHLGSRSRAVTVNSTTVTAHEPAKVVVVENRPQVVEPHTAQQVKPETSRPKWFLGSEEETLQVAIFS